MDDRPVSIFYSVHPWLIALGNLAVLALMSELGFRLGTQALNEMIERGLTEQPSGVTGFRVPLTTVVPTVSSAGGKACTSA
ncbi:MAG: hypothetical protein GX591_02215 [Planctomycetes bacterium]|nr:hypothetical protein [Planctomycetota bacterium]